MSDERWQRQWDLFHQALERRPQERDTFLREACGGDSTLLGQVQELLKAHTRTAGVLDATGAMRAVLDRDLNAEGLLGQHIGPYKLEAVLGVGGMGIVYAAQQESPIRRRVAVKLIRLGMDSREIAARFESERQALAILNHPCIAKVFDAGVTEQGRSYFVMEYVPGIAITEYCDLRGLDLRERLRLLRQACEAIEHAHRHGIIHRDLKPSNILVASVDGKPSLKVIDFGVAKAIGSPLTDQGSFTRQGIMIGTPEYMSPEQAGTTALEVDTRTDVYALGVLLYELLVGALPFDPTTLRRAAAMEMLRIIREEEPPRPSVRLASLGEARQDIARRRHLDANSLVRKVQGELEWITMRALEKDPDRRYPSASAVAADVSRYLDGRPVEASPPSKTYHVKKFLYRNKRAVLAATVILALLAAFGVQSRRAARFSGEQVAVQDQLAAVLRSVESKGLTVQQVWQGDMLGGPSPDGRYLSFVDWRTGDIAVHDFDTDEDRPLTTEGTWEQPWRFGDASIWSPDSRSIAYAWYEGESADLRIVDLEGHKHRVVYHDPEVGAPFPRDWSDDGRHILAIYCRKGAPRERKHEDEIVLIGVADGSKRVLKSLGERHTRSMDLSPDGRWVVYEAPPEPGTEQRDLFLVSTDGRESRLVDHVADDWAPRWTPDGGHVLFASSRSGSLELWQIAVIDGQPAGEAETLKLGLGRGFQPLGMTANGDYYYGTTRLELDVYLVDVDVAQRRALASPVKQSSRFDGSNTWPFWSPDGTRLGYVSSRATDSGRLETALVIRDVATDEERDLEWQGSTLLHYTPGGWAAPSWDPQGRWLLAVGRAPDGNTSLVRVDVSTGRTTQVLDAGARPFDAHWATLSRDGRSVFYVAPDKNEIRAHDLQDGTGTQLHSAANHVSRLALSPDGRWLAFFAARSAMQRPHRLEVLDLTEGKVKLLLELAEGEKFSRGPGLAWTPDGRFLLQGRDQPSGDAIELWRTPSTGGESAPIMTFPEGTVHRLSVHPNGRQIAFAAGRSAGGTIWVVRGIGIAGPDDPA